MQPGAEREEEREAVELPRVERPIASVGGTICIHHGGRAFAASVDQAGIFLRQVQRIISQGQSELIPLLHSGGVDLLFVTARTPLQVHDSRDRSFSTGHQATPAA